MVKLCALLSFPRRVSLAFVRLCARGTHSSVVSLGTPLGRECRPLLLHRTTPSVHVQTSGQPDEGRQPLSSAPEGGARWGGHRAGHESERTRDNDVGPQEQRDAEGSRGVEPTDDSFDVGGAGMRRHRVPLLEKGFSSHT